MEVAIGNHSSSTPFQREVREWQRIDPNTGHLLTARLEADRWTNGPSNSYGKVFIRFVSLFFRLWPIKLNLQRLNINGGILELLAKEL